MGVDGRPGASCVRVADDEARAGRFVSSRPVTDSDSPVHERQYARAVIRVRVLRVADGYRPEVEIIRALPSPLDLGRLHDLHSYRTEDAAVEAGFAAGEEELGLRKP